MLCSWQPLEIGTAYVFKENDNSALEMYGSPGGTFLLLLITYYLLLITYHLLLTAYYLLLITYHIIPCNSRRIRKLVVVIVVVVVVVREKVVVKVVV